MVTGAVGIRASSPPNVLASAHPDIPGLSSELLTLSLHTSALLAAVPCGCDGARGWVGVDDRGGESGLMTESPSVSGALPLTSVS